VKVNEQLPNEAAAVPAGLVHPPDEAVTLYVPATDVVMEEAVAPVLHDKEPVAVVDKVDVPLQLLTAVITGVAGVVPITAVVVPAALVHPLEVEVTLYVPAAVTVTEEAVAPPGLHDKVPVAVVEIVAVPLQLFTAVADGVVIEGTVTTVVCVVTQLPTVII